MKTRASTWMCGAVMACLLLLPVASAAAEETHVFDPVLSLTGGCTTSKLDPVPDPGCPEGAHPPASFRAPKSIAIDSYGNQYITSFGSEAAGGTEGRIDIFDSSGFFISQLLVPGGPQSTAVDTEGNLYVLERASFPVKLSRYEPTVYNPGAGEIKYGNPPVVIAKGNEPFFLPGNAGLAVNPLDNHLFVDYASFIAEFSSAKEGNKVLDSSIGEGVLELSKWIALDVARGRIYASDSNSSGEISRIRVFDLNPPHELLLTVDGSTLPSGKFKSTVGLLSVAVDESTGNFFVDDLQLSEQVYEFDLAGNYVSTIEHSFDYVFTSHIAVDNGANSPNGALNPNGRYLFVPSGPAGVGHSYAFAPLSIVDPPEVESLSFSGVTEVDAELEATINPGGGSTHYTFEYTTEQRFNEEGFAGALVAGEGDLPNASEGIEASAVATGLEPGTTYRYRVVAENECEPDGCFDEAEGSFTTYATPEPFPACVNDVFRIGLSAELPDCRAYELVTPADTNGRTPIGVGFVGDRFSTLEASPSGTSVSFLTEGGSLPGSDGTGAFNGDPYVATRSPEGWTTMHTGPTGAESMAPLPGSVSPDHGYSFWSAVKGEEGSAVIEGKDTRYVRYPDGHSELIGRGSLDVDPRALGKRITENGSHIIFATRNFGGDTAVQLEPNAPPDGTGAIYDRTADEVTHVVSLLPGDVTPAPGQDALYLGASPDGSGIAFSIGSTLYLRKDNAETFKVAEGATFAGIAQTGSRVFYVKGGDLFAFDAATEETIAFSESGNVTVVNVAVDGTRAYFVSPSVLTGSEENPNGAVAQSGKENLYSSEEGTLRFVGTVTKRDVEGEARPDGQVNGLGLWAAAVGSERLAIDPSRTTPDGSVLLFESRANLTGYDPGGHAQVYRYDSTAGTLDCLSCNPTQASPSGGASLQSIAPVQAAPEPFSAFAFVPNLRPDGRRAFFQTPEPLVLEDTDGLQDVYEWEEQGVGSCTKPGGCVYLISSGHSAQDDYLYGVSATGDDVFFRTADQLLEQDIDSTPSIYDARVNGGFPKAPQKICEGEGCRPVVTPPPTLPSPARPAIGANDNVDEPVRKCPKGKRKAKRNGKTVCVKKHRKKKHKGGSRNKGGRR